MFLRLFLTPFLIVCALVGGIYVFTWVVGRSGGSRTADEFLRDLDSANPEVRWRAASDLAQVLPRDERLASDSAFALKVADRLKRALDDSAQAEKDAAPVLAGLGPEDPKRLQLESKLEPGRNYVQFLTACLSSFLVPVGAPLLEQMAVTKTGLEPAALGRRRRQAVCALGNLGEKLTRFDALPPDRQEAIEEELRQAGPSGGHGEWGRTTLTYLQGRRQGKVARPLGVAAALVECARDEDPSLREWAAVAMNYWTGTDQENKDMDEALVALCSDDGRGEEQLAELVAGNKESSSQALVHKKKPGFQVQVNAAIALARRGSPRARAGQLKEMIDPEALRHLFVLKDKKTGAERPDEAMVVGTVIDVLKAVVVLHQKNPRFDLSELRAPLDRLAQDPNKAIQAEAREAQHALGFTE
jgi:hypothetical protein